MKRVLYGLATLLLAGVFGLGVFGCGGTSVPTAADGLDLHAVGSLVKSGRVQNAEQLREFLECGRGYNNLDLDADGYCENVNVTEYGNMTFSGYGAVRGYSLTVQMSDGSMQEVAQIQIRNDSHGVVMSMLGNEQIYGHGHNFDVRLASNVNSVPFLMWAFMPTRTVIYAPRPMVIVERRVVVPVTEYRKVTKRVVREVPMEVKRTAKPSVQSDIASPHAGQTSTVIKAPLKAPTTVQQQFQARPENKPVVTSGFKKKDAQTPGTGTPAQGVPSALPKIGEKKQTPAPPSAITPLDKVDPTRIDQKFKQRDGTQAPATGQFKKKEETAPLPSMTPLTRPLPGTNLPATPSTPPSGLPVLPRAGTEQRDRALPPSGLPTLPKAETPKAETPKATPRGEAVQSREAPAREVPKSLPSINRTPSPAPAAPMTKQKR